MDTQSRPSSSAPPPEPEHGAGHGVAREFFAARCWDWLSATGDELATAEHGSGSGGGDSDDVPVLPADWLYLTGSAEGVAAAE